MALHVALLESPSVPTLGAIAKVCTAADASMHVVGPLPVASDDPALVAAGPKDWASLDWWIHPGWRDFRDAMARERCLYFAIEAERDAVEAPFRPNSVLVVGSEDGALPDRIRDKYPSRIYRLPSAPRKRKADLAASVELLLDVATNQLAKPPAAVAASPAPTSMRYGRGRGTR